MNSPQIVITRFQILQEYKVALRLEERFLEHLDKKIKSHLELKNKPDLMDTYNYLVKTMKKENNLANYIPHEIGHPKEFFLNIIFDKPNFDQSLLSKLTDKERKRALDDLSYLEMQRKYMLKNWHRKYANNSNKPLFIEGLHINDKSYLESDIFEKNDW